MKIWITSDLHLGHNKPFIYEARGFKDIVSHDAAIIERWNESVGNKDEVYVLGDIFFGTPSYAVEILDSMNGKKYLVKGNHDDPKVVNRLLGYKSIEWAKNYYELKYNKEKYIMCHYPFETWNACHYGRVHFHGHTHSSPGSTGVLNSRKNRFNIGVDGNNCYPWFLDDLIKIVGKDESVSE